MSRSTIDARNTFCPGPLMELIAAIKLASIGDEIEILSSDKGSADDIPAWARKVGHEFLSSTQQDGHWAIVIRKKK